MKIGIVASLIKRLIIYSFTGAIMGAVLGFFLGYAMEEYGMLDGTWLYSCLEYLAGPHYFLDEFLPIFFAQIFVVIGVVLAIVVTLYKGKEETSSRMKLEAKAKANDLIKCSHCSSMIPATDLFCRHCGSKRSS